MRVLKPIFGVFAGLLFIAAVFLESPSQPTSQAADPADTISGDRSPASLIVAPDESWLLTINQTSGSVSLLSLKTETPTVVTEISVGELPTAAELLPDGKTVLVSLARRGELAWLEVNDGKLTKSTVLPIGGDPRAIAVSADGGTAYVPLAAEDKVAIVNLATRKRTGEIAVGRWPRSLCLSPDGTRLAVGCSGSGGVWMVDPKSREVIFDRTFNGLNIGRMVLSPDRTGVCFPWTFYGQRETSVGSIRQGWVMASRIAFVPFDKEQRPRGMSLDPRRNAVADGHGFAVSDDGERTVVAMGGTQELVVLRSKDLPWVTIGGSDHMDEQLAADRARFSRISVGGRPLDVRLSHDGNRAFVANYLRNSVQIVDLTEHKVQHEITLCTSTPTAARRGEAMFYNARRSLENWYSCHTCHYDAGPNSETIDTFNDGTVGTYKTVPQLFGVTETGPWTWHGSQRDLKDLVSKSFTTTMRGPAPTAAEGDDLLEFLRSVPVPTNPHRSATGELSAAAQRGKKVFESDTARCSECHSGPRFTDGENHDVGLAKKVDKSPEFNTPSLVNVYRRVRLLHDGRASSLAEMLLGPHNPEKISGGPLTAEERSDLIEYLNTL